MYYYSYIWSYLVSILILLDYLFLLLASISDSSSASVSILILLDYLFLSLWERLDELAPGSLNPYFTGLSILILNELGLEPNLDGRLNPYFTGLSILISIQGKLLQ